MNSPSSELETAFEKTLELLLAQRVERGNFEGELSASALSTATAVSALSFYLQRKSLDNVPKRDALQALIDAAVAWIAAAQNEDGGWGDTDKNYSNISTTMLVEAAFAGGPCD